MKTYLKVIFILFAIVAQFRIDACVTYNSGKGTYTVDSYGNPKDTKDTKERPKELTSDTPKIIKQPKPKDWDMYDARWK